MKGLWVIGLGIGIWGLSLMWPGINRMTPWWPILVSLVLAFGGLAVALIVERLLPKPHEPHNPGQDHPSRPVSVSGFH
jgi:hypothetical protein